MKNIFINKLLKALVFISFVMLLLSLGLPVFILYSENYSSSEYTKLYEKQEFEDIFHIPSYIYSIDGFGYPQISLLKRDETLYSDYEQNKIRIFERQTLIDLADILENCTYIPLARGEAFLLNLKMQTENHITKITFDDFWYDDENNPLFSKRLVNKLLNGDSFGICNADIYEYKGKLYLFADCTDYFVDGHRYKYTQLDFEDTSRSVFEIEKSKFSEELVTRKNEFSVDSSRIEASPIIKELLIVELIISVCSLLLNFISKKNKKLFDSLR